MEVNITKIGNSQGIRIPKKILKECNIGDKVDLYVEGNSIVLRAMVPPRAGWDEYAMAASKVEDDLLDDHEILDESEILPWE